MLLILILVEEKKICTTKKINILILVLSEKKFWMKQKTIAPPSPFSKLVGPFDKSRK